MNINKIKNGKFGKFLRRIAGEETGAVMMEYVIVAVMIAAAVAIGAWYFGRSVTNEFSVASQAVTGDITGAVDTQNAAQNQLQTQNQNVHTQQKRFISADDETGADVTINPNNN